MFLHLFGVMLLMITHPFVLWVEGFSVAAGVSMTQLPWRRPESFVTMHAPQSELDSSSDLCDVRISYQTLVLRGWAVSRYHLFWYFSVKLEEVLPEVHFSPEGWSWTASKEGWQQCKAALPSWGLIWNTVSRSGAVGAVPEDGCKDDQRAGAALLWKKVEGAELVQLREEEAPGRLHCSLPVLKGAYKHKMDQLFHSLVVIWQGGMVLNKKRRDLGLM